MTEQQRPARQDVAMERGRVRLRSDLAAERTAWWSQIEVDSLRAEVAALKAENAELRAAVATFQRSDGPVAAIVSERDALRAALVKVKRSVAQWQADEPLTNPQSVRELIAMIPDDKWGIATSDEPQPDRDGHGYPLDPNDPDYQADDEWDIEP